MKKEKVLGVKVTNELYSMIEEASKANNKKVSDYVRDLLMVVVGYETGKEYDDLPLKDLYEYCNAMFKKVEKLTKYLHVKADEIAKRKEKMENAKKEINSLKKEIEEQKKKIE